VQRDPPLPGPRYPRPCLHRPRRPLGPLALLRILALPVAGGSRYWASAEEARPSAAYATAAAVASVAGGLRAGPCVAGTAALILHHPDDHLAPLSAGERVRDAVRAAYGLATEAPAPVEHRPWPDIGAPATTIP
jgi:hypothetical protein